jgi:hypothetical protein
MRSDPIVSILQTLNLNAAYQFGWPGKSVHLVSGAMLLEVNAYTPLTRGFCSPAARAQGRLRFPAACDELDSSRFAFYSPLDLKQI